MKPLSPCLPIAVALLAVSTPFQATAATFSFKAQDAVAEGGEILWPDTEQNNQLKLAQAEGVAIGEKPEVGEDGKSLTFTGGQRESFGSVAPIQKPTTGFKIEGSFMVSPDAPALEQNGTLLRHGNWEIRCDPKNKVLGIVVWHENAEQNYTSVTAPIEIGVWQRFTATLESQVLTMDVNGVSNRKELMYPINSEQPKARLFLGAAGVSAEKSDPESFRAFCGDLADIQIMLE